MSRPVQAIINLAALRHNVQCVKACASRQKIMAVVKADAYGHGAVRVAQTLQPWVHAFAVCSVEEALVLRQAGIQLPVVLLEGFFSDAELHTIVDYALQPVIHCDEQVAILQASHLAKPITAWIKIDTGMHRLGFLPKQLPHVWEILRHLPHLSNPPRLMSHLACADDKQNTYTQFQYQQFVACTTEFKVEKSFANSAGIVGWPQTHFDWVRPGIMLYGVSPFINTTANQQNLRPVMQLQSELISIKHYRKGDKIGYGSSWQCPENMPIGVVAIGYGDGYPRHAPPGVPVLVNGHSVPLVGRVSMDMISVDLRHQPQAKCGDSVVLWGNGLPIEQVATQAQTIGYELLCGISQRVKRVVIEQ